MTLSLIAVNVLVFVVTAVWAAAEGHNPLDNYESTAFFWLSQYPVLVDDGQWWRLVTAAFLHIGPLHLVLNMLALLVFGSELERTLGRWRYLALYFLSILGGAAAIQLFGSPFAPVAGASTAIYGLLGGLGVLMLARRQDIRGLVTLLVINVLISFLPGVSLIGHLGGLVAGALTSGVFLVGRRSPAVQAAGAGALAVVLLVLSLAVSTVVVL